MERSQHRIDRRALIKTSAWAAPVVAVAAAAPSASASPAPNSSANYYWAAEAAGGYTTIAPAVGDLAFTYSTQIAYQADPYVPPPTAGVLVVTIDFTQPVTLTNLISGAWVKQTPAANGPATHFVFILTPSAQGGSLSGNFVGSAPGSITAVSTMSLQNGGSTTWSNFTSDASTTLVRSGG